MSLFAFPVLSFSLFTVDCGPTAPWLLAIFALNNEEDVLLVWNVATVLGDQQLRTHNCTFSVTLIHRALRCQGTGPIVASLCEYVCERDRERE